MGDLQRGSSELIEGDIKLKTLYYEGVLAEKLNQLKQLDVHLDNLRTVQMKKVELQQATLQKEIADVRREIKKVTAIEIKGKEIK